MLVKFTEVCNNGSLTTAAEYTLRDVFVNPDHVVMIREDSRIKRLNENGKLTSGLDINHRFSKLTIDRGQMGSEIVVVGAPDIVETKLKHSRKAILRG